MSVSDTTGVAAVATILATVADQDFCTVAELCAEHQLSRSSAFQVVSKLLAAGFLTRHDKGRLMLGPQAVQLGYARSGLAALAGPAEAILTWLQVETGAHVGLFTADHPAKRLVSIPDRAFESDFELPVCDERGEMVAMVHLLCRKGATRLDRIHAERCCVKAAETLEAYLQGPGARY